MASEKSLTAQFVDLQFYLPDRADIRLKGYKFKERLFELEQQLAQAQKQIEALQKRDGMLTEANAFAVTRYAQARALLEEVLPDSLPTWEKLIQCSLCGCSATQAQKIEHDDNCPIPRISAFLAQHQEPQP